MTPMFVTALNAAETHAPSIQERLLSEDLNLAAFDESQSFVPGTAFLPAEQASGFDWSLLTSLFARREAKHA